ncbi:FAD-binding oxidoreductase [Nocardia brevicatena]|uniref:FAD-binding oxidoreductase n=1 Tax=Nocardia brevicatena TaxID=37327 RepID=UPI0002EBA0DC|nr:FAD-binding oxidoreductase [Nocardia brevicatena]
MDKHETLTVSADTTAVDGWRRALGDGAVSTDPQVLARYQQNTSEYAERDLLAVVRPATTAEIQDVIRVARETGVAIHPISTGKNWGFGSALPVRGPVALVDLGRLDRIVQVDQELGVAVFEPGVTQYRLAEHLRSLGGEFKLNVTGSGRETSIVGNVLEHGGGHLGPRMDELLGLEVVLGDGTLVRTGYWSFAEGEQRGLHYPLGLGADLRGLFVQSNFGIVTKMALRLHRNVHFQELALQFTGDALADIVDALRRLYDEGVVTGYARIIDGADPHIRFFEHDKPATWTAQLTLKGTAAMRAAARAGVEARLSGLIGRIDGYDTEIDGPPSAEGPADLRAARWQLATGNPSDRSLQRLADRIGFAFPDDDADIDRYRELPGFLCVNVAMPFTGRQVSTCARLVEEASARWGIPVARFFGVVGPSAFSGFFPFYFDRTDAEAVQCAHRLKNDLLACLTEHGYYPMRIDVDSMEPFIARTDSSYWTTVRKIKDALDPQMILSPGRYCP